MEMKMKQITRMTTLAVLLLAGVSGTTLAKGPETVPPEPVRYTPPPVPAPVPAPVTDTCEPGAYFSGSVGIGIPEEIDLSSAKHEMDTGLALNGAIGYDFGDARLEAAVGYQKHDLSDSDDDVSLLTVMANAYYDIDTGSDITPYLMAGAGWAQIDASWDGTADVFVWQAGAGLGFKVAECTTLDLGYRYLKPNKFHVGSTGKWAVHNIMLGLRYNL